MTKKQRIEKLRKREAKRIEEIEQFWNDHRNPQMGSLQITI